MPKSYMRFAQAFSQCTSIVVCKNILQQNKSTSSRWAGSGRQADRQTGRQADRQTGRQADRQTARQPDSQTGKQPDSQTG